MNINSGKLSSMINNITTQNNPLSVLRKFLEREERLTIAKEIDKLRFVGYVLDLSYDNATIITSDPYKLAVGGIPRGSFLIMVPNDFGNLPYHFTLLRVTAVTTTPLSSQVQQTYFELHKKAMPELDIWTQNELQWGALDCDVLGMFYPNPTDTTKLEFSGDVNNIVSAHRYKVYAPDDELLNLIINGTVNEKNRYNIGTLRTMECQLGYSNLNKIPVYISMEDFKGRRTAMFGKTRLGKSNVVKLIASGMIEATKEDHSVGQLIFDINGEYANDNPQDGSKSIRSAYEDRCVVYALTQRANTPSKPLRLNFYEQPDSCMEVLSSLLKQDNKTSNYIQSFASVRLPSIDSIAGMPSNEKTRAIRKILYYWAILHKAGFEPNETRLKNIGLKINNSQSCFDPYFSNELRKAAYQAIDKIPPSKIPPRPSNLYELEKELEVIIKFKRSNPDSKLLESKSSGRPIFDSDDDALLEFFSPTYGSGPSVLKAYREYHSPEAGDFIKEILDFLDNGKTVILDLGNATDSIRRYFSDMLSRAVFAHQEKKFVNNKLGEHYIQLYFEEAHNLFPPNVKELTDVYSRFAKEGAKFHIGMVYSTQSPSTINKELLVQTENFFVGHLSSIDEAKALSRLQIAFSGVENDILKSKTPGYMRMLTLSHRFVVPVQANRFEGLISSN